MSGLDDRLESYVGESTQNAQQKYARSICKTIYTGRSIVTRLHRYVFTIRYNFYILRNVIFCRNLYLRHPAGTILSN